MINKRINTKEFIPTIIVPKQGNNKKLEIKEFKNKLVLKCKNCKNIHIDKFLFLTEEDFIAIGLYFAEGDKYINLDKRYHHSGEIAFANNDIKSIEIVIKLLEKLGIQRDILKWRIDLNIKQDLNENELIEYWIKRLEININNKRPKWIYRTGSKGTKLRKISSKYGCLHIYHNSVILRNVFLYFINKILNICIKNQLKEELALMMKGFFAGDGNVHYDKKNNIRQLEFATNDLEFIEKLRTILKILSLKSIKETWPEKTKTHSKALRIYNKHDFNLLNKYDIPNLIDYKKEIFMKIINSY